MSEYGATVVWRRTADDDFLRSKYSRAHEWVFDGGAVVPASSSPQVVPLPYSAEANIDPEEAFVASLSSCHMLFFLSIAAKHRFVVDEYVDHAIGTMTQDESGRFSITKVVLRPHITFGGDTRPTREQLADLHRQSHDQCFIANSVKTEVTTDIPA